MKNYLLKELEDVAMPVQSQGNDTEGLEFVVEETQAIIETVETSESEEN